MNEKKDVTEIEITPAMIEASVDWWMEEWGGEWPGGIDSVRAFFRGVCAAAMAVRPDRDSRELGQ